MKIQIKATNVELTSELDAYIKAKMESVKNFLSPADYDSAIVQVEVERTTFHHKSGRIFRAYANLHFPKGYFRAESIKEDLRAAIDDIKDELDRELAQHKDKKTSVFKKGARRFKDLIRGVRRMGKF